MKNQNRMIVISSAGLIKKPDGYYGYAPYVREMRLWAMHCGAIGFVCPVSETATGLLEKLDFDIDRVDAVTAFDVKSWRGIILALLSAPITMLRLFLAMRWSTHIHLRCPGNISLLGCLVAILFRNTPKTAKYAGNWDPHSAQPLSYRLQRSLLNSPALLTHIKVLVYGAWPGASKNIKPFFTATYRESDVEETPPRNPAGAVTMVFAGTLTQNKRPFYAIELVRQLRSGGIDARLEMFGDGILRADIARYIDNHGLDELVVVHGNRPAESVRQAYKRAHFAILPSESEGWPKAVAEGMFWGCVALATKVSCVPSMLDHGNRGILLTLDAGKDAAAIAQLLSNAPHYRKMALAGMRWSRQFTVDLFEREIKEMAKG